MPGPSIRTVLVNVTDVERSAQFYSDVLATSELTREDQMISIGHPEPGGPVLFLREAPRGSSHPGSQAVGVRALSWDVGSFKELDRVEARLRAHDAFRARVEMDDATGQFIHGHDPDRLALVFVAYQPGVELSADHFRQLTGLMYSLDV